MSLGRRLFYERKGVDYATCNSNSAYSRSDIEHLVSQKDLSQVYRSSRRSLPQEYLSQLDIPLNVSIHWDIEAEYKDEP